MHVMGKYWPAPADMHVVELQPPPLHNETRQREQHIKEKLASSVSNVTSNTQVWCRQLAGF